MDEVERLRELIADGARERDEQARTEAEARSARIAADEQERQRQETLKAAQAEIAHKAAAEVLQFLPTLLDAITRARIPADLTVKPPQSHTAPRRVRAAGLKGLIGVTKPLVEAEAAPAPVKRYWILKDEIISLGFHMEPQYGRKDEYFPDIRVEDTKWEALLLSDTGELHHYSTKGQELNRECNYTLTHELGPNYFARPDQVEKVKTGIVDFAVRHGLEDHLVR
jgi:hypothetical protein